MKTDASIHHICIAAIQRKAGRINNFKWSKYYLSNNEFYTNNPDFSFSITPNELIICSTIIDSENWSILTTKRMITCEKGIEKAGDMNQAKDGLYGNFKGYNALKVPFSEDLTFGKLEFSKQNIHYFIETGPASMIMIYGVKTLLGILNNNELV